MTGNDATELTSNGKDKNDETLMKTKENEEYDEK